MFDLEIEGARQLNRRLNNMALGAARKTVRPAMKEALEPIESDAKARAPVMSGRLKKTIKAYVKNSRRFGIIGAVRTGTRKQLRIPENSKYYYPAAIEFGTRHISPRSFLRKAISSKRDLALKILGSGIFERLKRL